MLPVSTGTLSPGPTHSSLMGGTEEERLLTSISPFPLFNKTPDLIPRHPLGLEIWLMQILGRSD
jgi:hypothetical protein